jgi:4-hydroxyphenylpyruvate dioxygenase
MEKQFIFLWSEKITKVLPGYKEWKSDYNPEPTGLKYIDHMVGNVGWNEMNTWVKFYEEVMGFVNFLLMTNKLTQSTQP